MSYRRRPAERTTNERVSAVHSSEEKPNKTGDSRYRSGSRSWPLEQEETRIWLICLVIRAINAVMVQTYFNPDEHWQSLEVAHRLSFGYGHLTWEWKEGIRSYLHPLIFALLYKILAFLHLDTSIVMACNSSFYTSRFLFPLFFGFVIFNIWLYVREPPTSN